MRSDRWLLVVALSLVRPLRVRGLRVCLGLVALGVLTLCGYPRCALAAKPSNADTAFRQVPLLAPSGGTDYVTGVGHLTWPSFLDSVLVRAIGGSDSILIASTRAQGVRIGLNGSVTYSFPPHTFANRVGTIVTANDWTDPLESTLPMLIASFTFADGRTWGTGTLYDVTSNLGYPYLLYYRVRNWSDQVVPGDPDFVTKPLNPAVFQLCAQASNGGVGNVYSDLQTFSIPDTLRNTALHTVTFASHTTAFDSTHITSAHGLVTGCAVWPQFRINNRLGDTLAVLRQDNSAWADSAYGGYYYQGVLIGTDGTIGENGCGLICAAMIHNYFRVDATVVTPDKLNHWLQTHQGYNRYGAIVIDSLVGQGAGDRVRFHLAPDGAPWRVGDHAVVEIQNFTRPAFEVQIDQLFAGSPPYGRATVSHAFETVAGGNIRAYKRGDMSLRLAGLGRSLGSPNPWAFDSTGKFGPTADKAERCLGDSLPAMLAVSGGGHFVVADGRRPVWVNSTTPLGTYSISDPLAGRWTLGAGYGNTFNAALYAKPQLPQHMPMPQDGVQAGEDAGLRIIAFGPASATVRDPSGNSIALDPGGSYVSEIPNAIALRGIVSGTPANPSTQSQPHDVFDIPLAASGGYVVMLAGEGSGEAGVYAESYSPALSTQAMDAAGSVSLGQTRTFVISYDALTRGVSLADVTGVEGSGDGWAPRLVTSPNPAWGEVAIGWIIPNGGQAELSVYDVLGRRIATLHDGPIAAGPGGTTWKGLNDAGRPVARGVYFVRLTSQLQTTVARVVLLGGR
jgi:hypothetical protein